MNVLRCLGEHFFKKTTSVFLIFLSVAACAAEKGYPEKPGPQPSKEVTFTLDAEGKVTLKDIKGNSVGEVCSSDPKAEKVCSLFQPGHKVEIEQLTNISVIRHIGTQCITVVSYDGRGVGRASQYCW